VYGADPGYYLLAAATLVPFLVIPAVIGSATTLVLVNIFPARRTRDLLALIGLLAAAGVVALFRFLRPERLMRPEEFRAWSTSWPCSVRRRRPGCRASGRPMRSCRT
jgi:ABC-2 type transport system permease protein